jgi:hypothetical protein
MLDHALDVDPNADRFEAAHHLFGPPPPHAAKVLETRPEAVGSIYVETEYVCLAIVLDGAELDALDDAHSMHLACASRLVDPVDRIVVRERDGNQPYARRLRNDVGRRARAVGRCRMDVEVYEAGFADEATVALRHDA